MHNTILRKWRIVLLLLIAFPSGIALFGQTTYNVRLMFHLVRNDAGEMGSAVADLQPLVDRLNDDFSGATATALSCSPSQADSYIRFTYEGVIYEEEDFLFVDALSVLPNPSNVINVYVNLEPRTAAVAGCSMLKGQVLGTYDVWVKSYDVATADFTLTHEIGHLMGLGHYGTGPNNNFMTADASGVTPCHFTSGQISTMQGFLTSNTSIWSSTANAQLPVADWESDVKGTCVGQTVVFTSLATSSTTGWQWNISPATFTFVSGTSATDQNPEVEFTAPGNYDVSLVASNSAGTNTFTRTGAIRVSPTPVSSFPYTEDFSNSSFYNQDWYVEDHGPEAFDSWAWDEELMIRNPASNVGWPFCSCNGTYPICFTNGASGPNGTAALEMYHEANNQPWYNQDALLYTPDFDFSNEEDVHVSFFYSHIPMTDGNTTNNDCDCAPNAFLTAIAGSCTNLYPPTMWNPDPVCGFNCQGSNILINQTCNDESLTLEYSLNCGANWTTAWSATRNQLGTSPLTAGTGSAPVMNCSSMPVPPLGADWWRQITVDLPCDVIYADRVKFRFVYHAAEGTNNLYIDDFAITTNTNTQTVSSSTTWSAGQVTGTVTVVSPAVLTITGGTTVIGMLPNAQINVQPGAGLVVTNGATIQAECDYMWDGIYVDGPTASVTVNQSSTIMESQNGIVSISGGDFVLDEAILDENYRHLQVLPYSSPHTGTVSGSQFTSNSLIAPYSGMRTAVAIDVTDNDQVSIGDLTAAANDLENMDIGVRIYRSTVYMNNNNVSQFTNPSLLPGIGFGVYEYGDATQRAYFGTGSGGGATSGTNFFDGHIGVAGKGITDASISDSEFNNVREGIAYSLGAVPSPVATNRQLVSIRDNEINTILNGVRIERNYYGDVGVINNIITCSGVAGTTGVLLNKLALLGSTIANTQISDNEISDAANGIYSLNMNNVTVTGNDIDVPVISGSNTNGIQLMQSSKVTIHNNEIYCLPSSHSGTAALRSHLVGLLTLSCNDIHDIERGGIFSSFHTGAVIKGNALAGCLQGFVVQTQAILGNQGSTGNPYNNKWTSIPSASNAFALYSNTHLGSLSHFHVRTTPSYYNPTTGNSGSPATSIAVFTNPGSATGYICSNGINLKTSEVMAENETLLLDILDGKIDFGDTEEEMEYLIRLCAYSDITTYPDDFSDDIFDDFISDMGSTNAPAFMEASQAMLDGDLDEAEYILENVSSVNQTEDDYLFASLLLRQRLADETFMPDEGQIGTLTEIANKCPGVHGHGVTQARLVLWETIGTDLTSYDDNCSGYDKRNPVSGTEDKPEVAVFPNPTNGLVHIAWTNVTPGAELDLHLMDMSGKKVLGTKLVADEGEGAVSLELPQVPAGIYMAAIYNGGEMIYTGKLVVLK